MADLADIIGRLGRGVAAGGRGIPFFDSMNAALGESQNQDLLRIELERQQERDELNRLRTQGLVDYYRNISRPRVSQPKPTKAEESLQTLQGLIELFGPQGVEMWKRAAPAAGGLGIKPEKAPEGPKPIDVTPSASMLSEPFPLTADIGEPAPGFPLPELLPFDPRALSNPPPEGRSRLHAIRGGEAVPLPFLSPQEEPPLRFGQPGSIPFLGTEQQAPLPGRLPTVPPSEQRASRKEARERQVDEVVDRLIEKYRTPEAIWEEHVSGKITLSKAVMKELGLPPKKSGTGLGSATEGFLGGGQASPKRGFYNPETGEISFQ